MKGTLFSADFVNDADGNLRLLELNTDTGIVTQAIPDLDWSGLFSVISGSNITELDIIYKPLIHNGFLGSLTSSIESSSLSGSLTVSLYEQDLGTIYPTIIDDDDNKFILRLSYDESAIFDSTYCKERVNVYNLYSQYDSSSYVSSYYASSSDFGVYDTIDKTILNPPNIPDFVMKNSIEAFKPMDFVKIGSEVENETIEDRWNATIEENKSGDVVIEQYHYNSSSVDSDGCITSVRSFNIVYGSNLDIINLLNYRVPAIFSLPTDISDEITGSVYTSKITRKHYYEYTTNFMKLDSEGVLSTQKVKMMDGTYKEVGDIVVGDVIESYHIEGSPAVESTYEATKFSFIGSNFPSGSFVTSSEVVFKETTPLSYGGLVELVVDNDSMFSGVGKLFLTYNSSSDSTTYKNCTLIDPSTDYFFDQSGSLIDIDESNFYITSDETISVVELDVEDTDTYILSGSTSFNSVISHNAPCFVAGTSILLENNETKNIEDVVAGDKVITYNHSKEETEIKEVTRTIARKIPATVLYEFEDGTTLESTWDHPIYDKDNGYVSFRPDMTFQMYSLRVAAAQVGMNIMEYGGGSKKIKSIIELKEPKFVYNLYDIKDNHNYFANELLVHNRCFVAGTEITLSNGDVKNIEDIIVGEEVLTFNEETKQTETGTVGDLKKHEVDKVIRLTLDNENIIITTHEHPFYVIDKGWVKASELQWGDVCLKSDGTESFISTVEELEETHVVYNLLSVNENHNFYANGILVHNK